MMKASTGDLTQAASRTSGGFVFLTGWNEYSSGPFEFYGLPNGSNDRIKAGEHGAGPEVDPDSDPVLEQDRVDAIRSFVRERLPSLDPEPEAIAGWLATLLRDAA